MSDSSDNILLNDPEFEAIRNQAMAFEKLYDMTAVFELYVDHVQSFPERAKEFARGADRQLVLTNGSRCHRRSIKISSVGPPCF